MDIGLAIGTHAIRGERYLLRLEKLTVQILMVALVIITFAQVIFRYLLQVSLPWSEELARYLFIWVSFIGAAIGVATRDHFGIEFLIERIKGRPRIAVEAFSYAASFVFMAVLLIYGTIVVLQTRHLATSLPLSMKWFYAAIPIGAALMLLHLFVHITNRVFVHRLPPVEEVHPQVSG